MQIAKDYNLTCITPDHQIVYAGAFITSVGQFNRSQADRPTLYRKVTALERLRDDKLAQAQQFDRLKDQLADKELEALRKHQKAEVTLSSLKTAVQQVKSMMFEFKNQIEHKTSHT